MVHFANNLQAEAVIFDFDGVIVDTEPLHYRAFQRVLEPHGFHFTWQQYVETYIGFDDRDAFKEAFIALNRELDAARLQQLITAKAAVFQDVIRAGVVPYPGVIELVRRLHASGTPLAICSGALLSDILPILTLLELGDCFSVIVTADDVAASKPDPDCYRLTFDRLSALQKNPLTKGGVLVIEDTPAGISAALGAGLRVVAVTNSYPADKLTAATYTTVSLEELLGMRVSN
ncbi:MAG TPA: HAD family phosphatase [Desulfuromonadales bacterium]|nr:HAD family phosphatase [Desulfuromonadales bacterium]